MNRRLSVSLVALSVLLVSALPAQAEAINYDYGKALLVLLGYAVLYLGVAITLLVLAVRRKWRRFRRVALAAAAVLVLFPLLDMALYAWQNARIANAQVRATAPRLIDKTVLFISPEGRCMFTPCQGLAALQDGDPLWTIAPETLDTLDLSQPIDLATVPMSWWVQDPDAFNDYQLKPASGGERPTFDYVIYARSAFYLARSGAIEAALPHMPTATLLGDKLYVLDFAAPLTSNQLSLAQLKPDLLNFYNARTAYKVPLFIEHYAGSAAHSYDWRTDRANWYCGEGAGLTRAQQKCSNAFR